MTSWMGGTVLIAEGPRKAESWCKRTLSLCLAEPAPAQQTQPAPRGREQESRDQSNQDHSRPCSFVNLPVSTNGL